MDKDANTSGLDSIEIKQTIFRLAHFNPTCNDEYGNQVLDYLVLDSLVMYGRLVVSALQIKENIKNSFHLDFEETEINLSGKRLSQKRLINFLSEEKGKKLGKPTFQILPDTEQKITNNLAKIHELDNIVIQEWKQEIIDKYKEYPLIKDNIELIIENMKLFMSRMFIRHGVECVALLYPEDETTHRWLKKVESSILEDLPKTDSFVDAIVKLEIPRFFKNPDSKRKAYITSLFNSSFFWHLIQVDEKCSKLLREVTKGQSLYLDNNILYSLVGFDGASMLQSVHSMLKIAKTLGYKLWVTTKTIDEFHFSLNWQMKELKMKPPIPSELARIAIENLEEDNFLTVYWKDFVKNGTSIEEFVAEKKHLEDLMRRLGIISSNKFRKEIEESQELLDEESILRSACISYIGDHVVEHDSFHRILINKIRQGHKHNFSEAVAWFLTHDSKLPTYDRVARKGNDYLPFCITSDQWIQINRPLLERTANQEEYEESFHILVTQPFLRTMMPTFSLAKAYNEVLGRLARYKNMNPKLALSIVTDKHFMTSMASQTTDEKIEQEIESKLVDIATQLRSEKEILEKSIQDENVTTEKLDEKIKNLEITVEENKTKHQEQVEKLENTTEENKTNYQEQVKRIENNLLESEARYQRQIEGLNENLDSESRKKEKAEIEFHGIENKFETLKANVVRWSIFAGVLVLTSMFLWLHQYFIDWNWLNTHKNNILIKIALNFLFVFAFLNIPVKQHWKLWLTLFVALIIAILKLACS